MKFILVIDEVVPKDEEMRLVGLPEHRPGPHSEPGSCVTCNQEYDTLSMEAEVCTCLVLCCRYSGGFMQHL